jgi:hypothetical protein
MNRVTILLVSANAGTIIYSPRAKRRNIIIASTLIVVLAISLVTGLIVFYHQPSTRKPAPTKLNVNVSACQTNILQGGNLFAEVNVTSKGKAENVTLSCESSSSWFHCSFEPAKGTSNFTSWLAISVPDSTPTGNYSAIVTASGGGAIENATCIFSVVNASALSPYVIVTGTVSADNEVALTTVILDQIQFTDTQTDAITTVDLFGAGAHYASGEYSVVLQNEQIYDVTVTVSWGGAFTFDAGNLYVYAPAGNSTMHQDFSVWF